MRTRRVPLRTRLFVLAAAGMLPLAIVCGLGLAALVQQQRSQAERAGVEIARALAIAVDAELDRSIAALQVLASASALERGEMQRFYEVTHRVMEANPTWLTVILADPAGKQLMNSRFPVGAKLPGLVEAESFTQAARTLRPVVGYLARGSGTQFAVPVRVPVLRDGKLRYVLTAAVKPDGLVEIIRRQRVPSDWVVSVFDGKNMRVARSRQHREYVGSPPAPSLQALMLRGGMEGSGVTLALEGEAIYTACERERPASTCTS